ncbi:NADPH oxidase 4 isoform X2 [Lingula anatina]|uniref:NADPH oxidase 4 isoform X2 n=1 Tax=Lingula anatina TaxID=7574 RepID=A0A1S3IYJ6_LINAN|nr:NADPH oxidase 4 isoform X2 [Lingula anatina]|eukprot:XP_013403280.1 NADPH oxidase 4 isoform X2 [Lingula anatina]
MNMWRWLRGFLRNCGLRYSVVVLWIVLNAVVFTSTYRHWKYAPKYYYVHQILGPTLCISRGTAAVLNLNCGLVLLPMCRVLVSLMRFSRISRRSFRMLLDHCKGFHMLCGLTIVLASVIHFIGHLFNAANFSIHFNPYYVDVNGASYKGQDPLYIVAGSVPGITGLVLMLVLCTMATTSLYVVRTNNYDLFWYTHRFYLVFYFFLMVHAVSPGCDKENLNLSIPWPEPEHWDTQETVCEEPPVFGTVGCSVCILHNTVCEEPPVFGTVGCSVCILHNTVCEEPPVFGTVGCSSWMWVGLPLLVYLVDLTYRRCKQGHCTRILNVTEHPGDVLEIRVWKKGFKAKPGQFILVQCPAISSFEWHPFTVSMCPTSQCESFTIHIHAVGDWSGRLQQYLTGSEGWKYVLPPLASSKEDLDKRLVIEGPYGSPSGDILKYRVNVLIAGGIGVTPFTAFLHHLYSNEKLHLQNIERIYFIWMCKDLRSFKWFTQLLCRLYQKLWSLNRPDLLCIRLHVTAPVPGSQLKMFVKQYPLLEKRLYIGRRPDWPLTLMEICSSHKGTDIGVFCCGPKGLATNVEEECSRIWHKNANLFCHHESF